MTGPNMGAPIVNGSEVDPHTAGDNDSDSSSDSIDSMTSEEIQDTFIERHGRHFHSQGNGAIGPYPFPVDEQEKTVSLTSATSVQKFTTPSAIAVAHGRCSRSNQSHPTR